MYLFHGSYIAVEHLKIIKGRFTKDNNVYRIYDYFFSEWLAKVY